jgi:hypothetical protein
MLSESEESEEFELGGGAALFRWRVLAFVVKGVCP